MTNNADPQIVPRPPASLLELRAADQGVADALESVLSDNTRRVYGTQWRLFDEWCAEVGLVSLPAEPLTVARYLAARAGSGASIATMRLAMSAIGKAHEWAKQESPRVRQGRRGPACHPLRRPDSAAPRLRLSPGATCSAGTTAAAASPSSAPRPKWKPRAPWWPSLHPPCEPLDAIRPVGVGGGGEQVLGLLESQIARRVKVITKAAGLADWEFFSGHSGRVGMARRMAQNGVPTHEIERQGRWKQGGGMVGRYTRGETAGFALLYL